ncbi:P31B10 protein [Roseibium sp. TrichSKD4]|nr:P31B10 protein [Roseibium sp. TrichSKD4]
MHVAAEEEGRKRQKPVGAGFCIWQVVKERGSLQPLPVLVALEM